MIYIIHLDVHKKEKCQRRHNWGYIHIFYEFLINLSDKSLFKKNNNTENSWGMCIWPPHTHTHTYIYTCICTLMTRHNTLLHAHTHSRAGRGRRGTEFKMRTMKCYKCKEYMNLRTYNNNHLHWQGQKDGSYQLKTLGNGQQDNTMMISKKTTHSCSPMFMDNWFVGKSPSPKISHRCLSFT